MILIRYILILSGIFFSGQAMAKENCAEMSRPRTCLICNCYHESRGESHKGIVAVGKVVISRTQSPAFPNTVCGVIKDPGQFVWWPSKKSRKMSDTVGYNKCVKATEEILKFRGFYGLYYHTTAVRPRWARGCGEVGRVGTHIFYKDCSNKQHASKNLTPVPEGGVL